MALSWPARLSGWKDASLSKLLLMAARQYLKDIGEVLDLALDSASRTLAVDLLPVGECEPIRVQLFGYDLECDATGENWLTFERLVASREWMTRAVARFLPRKRLPLPHEVPAGLLRQFL